MIREIIVTSPQGVRLAFEASGDGGLAVRPSGLSAQMVDICDRNKPCEDGCAVVGVVPNSWLIELNENVT
jgi:hypothetical protein